MNILFIASSSGTLSYHLTRLSIALKKRGFDITVVSGVKEQVNGLSAELAKTKIEHFKSNYIDKIDLLSIYKGKESIQKILKIKDIDVIHANGAIHSLHAYLGTRTLQFNKRPAIITSIHSVPRGNVFLRMPKWIGMTITLKIASNKLLPVSNYTRTQLTMHGLAPEKVITVHNAIDLDVFDNASKTAFIPLEKEKDRPNIVYVANLIPVKGHEYYLMAAKKILKKYDAKFYVIGDGPRRKELEKLAYKLGIKESIVFTGSIYWPKIYWVLSNISDICVSSSLSENFPFYIIECMAARKPVVATNVGGISEAIIDGINGYLVPPRDSTSLAKAASKLIENQDKAREMGLKGRQIVEKRFSMKVITRRLEKIYEETVRS